MNMLSKWDQDPEVFLQRTVTGSKTRLSQYALGDKVQWVPRGASGPVKAKEDQSWTKVMATVFWDPQGLLFIDFLEGQRTITFAHYEIVFRKLTEAIAEKCPGKHHHRVLLHHNSEPAQSSHQSKTSLWELWWEITRHPPYIPDVAPSHFFLYLNVKNY